MHDESDTHVCMYRTLENTKHSLIGNQLIIITMVILVMTGIL
jgi:hypothetical protein